MKKQLLSYIGAFVGLIAVYMLLMTAVYTIPNSLVEENMDLSIKYIDLEGDGPHVTFYRPSSRVDNYSDRIIYQEVLRSEDASVLYSAMDNQNYARYWHGHSVYMRPLSVFFDITQVRFILMVAFYSVAALLLVRVGKRFGGPVAAVFFIGLMAIYPNTVSTCLQLAAVFLVAFVFAMLAIPVYDRHPGKIGLLLFVAGSVANFFDLLTVPLVSLGIPLVVILLIEAERAPLTLPRQGSTVAAPAGAAAGNAANGAAGDTASHAAEAAASGASPSLWRQIGGKILLLARVCIAWVLGYGGTWLAKWLIGSAVLQRNVLADAIQTVLFRTEGKVDWFDITYPNMFRYNIENILLPIPMKWNAVLILAVLALAAAALVRSASARQRMKGLWVLLPVAVMPYCWYTVLLNHSCIHSWFTYRLQILTLLSLGICVVEIFRAYRRDYPGRRARRLADAARRADKPTGRHTGSGAEAEGPGQIPGTQACAPAECQAAGDDGRGGAA